MGFAIQQPQVSPPATFADNRVMRMHETATVDMTG